MSSNAASEAVLRAVLKQYAFSPKVVKMEVVHRALVKVSDYMFASQCRPGGRPGAPCSRPLPSLRGGLRRAKARRRVILLRPAVFGCRRR